ncbi:hypothetical protein [Methylobacterium isbiliense]|uniref:Uncharacterized protein n=1 Tax=Methylobacterium isbiliense TaxID=315478 RepID=A0ABQ4SA83_9HYPH|nr:hypothetical protein [Methylobacterium isbiliense]MDN3625582.1 hypothetical protein [Methylobacterium isbiliense]GJE00017.1 hypothetical protein GMJLKIPL_1935 [Methylobacterium isbiliense]
MAKPEDIDAPMTLEIDGTAVSPEKFIRALTAFFDVVREVSPTLDDGTRPEWTIQVKQGSNLVGAYPGKGVPSFMVDHILAVLGEGVAQIEKDAVEPEAFTDKALASLRKLGQISGRSGGDDTLIRVWVGKHHQRITQRSVANVTQILEATYVEHGSVTGRLQTITERGGLKFLVDEELWGRQVRCNMPDRLVPDALKAFRKRVEVYGPVRYRRDGVPFSVFVKEIEVMPEKGDLPTIEDVYGILRSVD